VTKVEATSATAFRAEPSLSAADGSESARGSGNGERSNSAAGEPGNWTRLP
jgi:hypothetical protein